MKHINLIFLIILLSLPLSFGMAENRIEFDLDSLYVGMETVEIPILCENDVPLDFMCMGFKVTASDDAYVEIVDLEVMPGSRADVFYSWYSDFGSLFPPDSVYIVSQNYTEAAVNPGPLEHMFTMTINMSCCYMGVVCFDTCRVTQAIDTWLWTDANTGNSIKPIFNNNEVPICRGVGILPCGFLQFITVPEDNILIGNWCSGVSFQFEAEHEFDPEYYKVEGYDFCYFVPYGASITEDGLFTFAPNYSGFFEFTVRAYGTCPNFATYTFDVYLQGSDVCGDANCDGAVNVSDAVHIIDYIFVGGAPPNPMEAGDANCDSTCNVSDAVWIINYIFVGGNDPGDTDGDGIPDC
jgi:hypothetical protein